MTTDSLTISRALQAINNLERSLAQARKENRFLRAKTEESHPYHRNTSGRILRRALEDASTLLMLQAAGYPTSRRYLYEMGISERRYGWAVGLLRSARVVSPRGRAWWAQDFVSAEAKIKAEYDRLKGQPNALERLRLYMSKSLGHAYRGKKR